MKTPKVATPKTFKLSNTPKSGLVRKKSKPSGTPFKGSSASVKLLKEYAEENNVGKVPSKNSPEVELGLKIEAHLEKGFSSSPGESVKTPLKRKSLQSVNKLGATPQSVKKIKSSPQPVKNLEATPKSVKQFGATPKSVKKPKSSPQSGKNFDEATPQSVEQLKSPLQSIKKLGATPKSVKKPKSSQSVKNLDEATPQSVEQLKSPQSIKKLGATPKSAKMLKSSPQSVKKLAATPQPIEKIASTPQSVKKLSKKLPPSVAKTPAGTTPKLNEKSFGGKTPKLSVSSTPQRKSLVHKTNRASQFEEVTESEQIKTLKDYNKVTLKSGNQKSSPTKGKQSLLEHNKVVEAVNALFTLHKEKLKENPQLLGDNASNVNLTINCIKSLVTSNRFVRITVPHRFYPESIDVCVIVREKLRDVRNIVEHYKNILDKFDLKANFEVMTLRTMRKQNTQYEQKRKFSNRYDMFIVEAQISHQCLPLMGKFGFRNRKIPVPVKNLSDRACVETAMRKATLNLNSFKHSFTLAIGTTEMTADEVADNIIALVDKLKDAFPNGWINIRSLLLTTPAAPRVTLYFSTLTPNDVPIPVALKPRKMAKPVCDELSTIPGALVTVHPSGRVVLRKTRKNSTSDEETEVEGHLDTNEEITKPDENNEENVETQVKSGDEEVSSDDEKIEAAEEEYLMELEKESDTEPIRKKQKPTGKKQVKKGGTASATPRKKKMNKKSVA